MKNWFRAILPQVVLGIVLAGILYPFQHVSLNPTQFISGFSFDENKPGESLQQNPCYIISASALDRMPWETMALPIEVTEEDTSEKDSVRTNFKGSFSRFNNKHCQFLRSYVTVSGHRIAEQVASNRLFILFEVIRI